MTPTCRVEIHPEGLCISYSDRPADIMPLIDSPALVVALLRRGRVDAARLVNDVWFVSHAQAAGLGNIVLGGGP